MYAIDWQSLGVFAYTPALPLASREGRMIDWQSGHLWETKINLSREQRIKYKNLADASQELSK